MTGDGSVAERGTIAVLAGGVGAARFLRGLVRAVPPETLRVVVNTGDDYEFYGALVCPDLDIVTYTLAGCVDPQHGYGIAGDRFELIAALGRFGHATWFRLGDRDFATCQHRSLRLREGWGLARIQDEIRRSFGVRCPLLPMSEDPCPTWIELADGRRLHFEEYLVREGAPDEVRRIDLSAACKARPAPGVCEALESAGVVILAPSNPIVSIGPILALPGLRERLRGASAPVVAISPIVAGLPLKGPADKLLRASGCEVSALGVARLYADFLDGFVLDARDAAQAPAIEALGLRALAVDTIMRDAAASRRLAEAVLEFAGSLQ